MKIAFTGGGTGGHFYPIIAIAEALQDLVREEHLITPSFYYLAPDPFDKKALFENEITYIRVPAGKLRRYVSVRNFFDFFVTASGIVKALFSLYAIYPDVLVSKGGYGSVPSVIAAWILKIPIIIHESDAKPGRANLFASRFATKIAISFESAALLFPKEAQSKIARTGTPTRKALMRTGVEGARQFLNLEPGLPTILILGGSLGAARINDTVLSALPELITFANVIHQTGHAHFAGVSGVAKVVLEKNQDASRYHPFDYLDQVSMQRASSAANLVISRAGASSISEISLWQKPAILIPIPESVSHDQRTNAYEYARTGAAIVIEESNLSPHLLASEARRIIHDPDLTKRMSESAKTFTDPDAARVIARATLDIALTHEA